MRTSPNRTTVRAALGRRVLLIAAALLSTSTGPYAFAGPKSHTIVIEGMQFTPQVLEVSQGDTITWVNKDAFPHNATAENKTFHSKDIAPNGSWKFKVVKKGSFSYLCTLHPTMKASLVVK